MRFVSSFAALALSAAPLHAQGNMGGMNHDPDNKVAGGGVFPAGWVARLDRPDRGKLEDVKFVAMDKGYHATMGPAAIFYTAKNNASGNYTLKGTFTQTKAPSHPEAYGLFTGGKNLDQPNQEYIYYIVRGDGKFMVKHRAGSEVHTIQDWTDSPAINKADANGKATNALAIRSTPDSIVYMANGKMVWAMDRSHAGAGATEGTYGIRINHNLDVHVDGFEYVADKAPAKVKK